MSVPTVRMKIRVKLATGSRAYVNPVLSPNGKLKPHCALVRGCSEHHPEGVYHLRYLKGGKRIWDDVGSDPQLAMTAKLKVEHRLMSISLGLAEPDPVARDAGRTNLVEAMAEYLDDIAQAKSKNTLYAYTRTLRVFAASCREVYMERIDRRDILNYHNHLKESGNVPRTISNYSNFLKIFFNHKKLAWPLLKTDRVKYTEKAVSAYGMDEIQQLLAAADQDETELFQFFLFTGAREKEVQFATWRDVNFTAKSFTVTEKLDLGFTPKDKEEGEIPIPDSLVDRLRLRRKRFPHGRLIFPGVGTKTEVLSLTF